MKNGVALLAGLCMIMSSVFLASGSANQVVDTRPQVAQVMATGFHQTPSASPTHTATAVPTMTPTPMPTALLLTGREPTADEIVDVLFQYPEGARVLAVRGPAQVQTVALRNSLYTALVVTGNGIFTLGNGRSYPGVFAAILAWRNDQYRQLFRRVELGRNTPSVQFAASPSGDKIDFLFRNIGLEGRQGTELRRLVTLECFIGACRVSQESAAYIY